MNTCKIIGFAKRFRKVDNVPFYVFILRGRPTAHISSTGKVSVSIPKTSVPANCDDEELLQSLIGETMDGEIRYIDCAPTKFTAKDGSEQTRTHEWKFFAKGSTTPLNVPESVPSDQVVEDLAS